MVAKMPISKKNLIFSFLVLISALTNLTECITYKRKKIVYQGDIMIGALLPVHEQPSYSSPDSTTYVSQSRRVCGVIRDQYGVQRVEALLYTLDKINSKEKSRLLPGIRLGLEIRDECWDSSIALEETIDFIKDTIATDSSEEESQMINSSSPT